MMPDPLPNASHTHLYRGSVSAYPGNVEFAKHPVVVAPPRADEILLQSPRMSYAWDDATW